LASVVAGCDEQAESRQPGGGEEEMFRPDLRSQLGVFLLQGALIPVLLVVAGTMLVSADGPPSGLEGAGRERSQHRKTLASLLKMVPKLQPLNCAIAVRRSRSKWIRRPARAAIPPPNFPGIMSRP
jgi:hypothetical protein